MGLRWCLRLEAGLQTYLQRNVIHPSVKRHIFTFGVLDAAAYGTVR